MRLQWYANRELPDVTTGFRKVEGSRDQIANICWIIEKAREFQKNIYVCFTAYAKPLTVWIATNWKKSVFILVPKKGNVKKCSNYHTVALISQASRLMLQARLQPNLNRELPDVQAGFRKRRGTRDQIANIHWIIEKAREFKKNHLPLFHLLCQSLWLCRLWQTVESY